MSADRFKIKRGSTSAVNAYMPALGEPVMDLTLNQLRIGDGTTLGGVVVGVPTSAYMATVLNDIDAPTARTTLGAQSQSANLDTISALASVANLSALANLSSVTNLTYLNTITPVANGVPYGLTASTWGSFSITSQGRTLVGTSSQATARTTIAAAGSGANSDITSLTGLTTALSVTQGGTGVTTVAAQVAPLQTAGLYGKTNVLGTVSQTSGVPTGSVIETGGTLALGKYTKFADGTMVFHRRLSVTTASTLAAGSMFYSGGIAATSMGVTFVGDLPTTTATLEDALGISWVTTAGPPTLTNFNALYILTPTSTASRTYNINLTAYGKWF